ncbi:MULTISPECIES: hypothetical protein [unclassified Knoellia]|uniref:hypothetical protein n=1 Tax=unclassified Knoellia TaxID=2618719 RepID=UPI0023DCC928|nr:MULTISPECIES: hypothetical protein [unclassified Knoellia]MDF2093006.1 hypothetical protein [Knoellia sp. 3-2P3]MDF2146311.1 hypothetical protein [Knoellia sp. p5-6-4]
MAADPAVAAPVTAPVTAPGSVNPLAWRNALVSAAALWVGVVLVLLVLNRPYTALTYIGPLLLCGGVMALVARRLPVRVPLAVYPVVVLGLATVLNAPVLDLVF